MDKVFIGIWSKDMGKSFEKWIENCIDYTKEDKLKLKNIRDYQIINIKKNIDYVKEKSLFYHRKLKDIDGKDIKTLSDFMKLIPFTSPKELSNKPGDFLCVPQYEISRIVTLKTSGTLGENKRVFFTETDLERTIDFFHNGMKSLVSPGDKVLILMPGDSYGSIGELLKKGLKRLGCEGICLGIINDNFKILDILKKENIDCIVGLPIQIYQLARLKNCNNRYKDINLKTVLLTGDYVPDSIREVVEKNLNCKALSHYGMTEIGFGGGVECKCREGYYLREGDIFFEIIDPFTKRQLSPGKEGEIVITTLTRKGMPLIRYRTGDMASFNTKPCKCNSILPRINRVRGRLLERMNVNNTHFYIGDIDEGLFTIENLLDYRVRDNNNVIQLWTKSIDNKNPVKLEDIQKALYKIGLENINLEYCGEMINGQIFNSMYKRKIESI